MKNIAKEIDNFSPVDGNWLELDKLVCEIKDINSDIITSCLAVFERFPEQDGAGVFFSIIHALEYHGGFENELANSVINKPNQWNLLMLNRFLNADIDVIGDYAIYQLLMGVINNNSLSEELRNLAKDYLG